MTFFAKSKLTMVYWLLKVYTANKV